MSQSACTWPFTLQTVTQSSITVSLATSPLAHMLTSMPALRKHSPALVWCTDHTTQQMPRLRAGLLFGSLLLDGHEEALRMLHNADKLLPVHRLERLPHHRATHPFFAECAAVIGLSEPPERRQELPGPACKVTTSPKSWPRSRQRNACCTAAGCCCRCRQSRKDEASATFLGCERTASC